MANIYSVVNNFNDNMMLQKGVKFLLYVGKNHVNGFSYNSRGDIVFGVNDTNISKKVLVLGESHYIEDYDETVDIRNFTRKVIGAFYNAEIGFQRWMNTLTKFSRALNGEETDNDANRRIYDSLIFYNYLQVPLYGPRMKGDGKDYEDSQAPLFAVLEMYRPDIVIVWGLRLWDALPDDYSFEWCPDFLVDKTIHRWGSYKLSDGKRIKFLPIYHPSLGFKLEFLESCYKESIQKSLSRD